MHFKALYICIPFLNNLLGCIYKLLIGLYLFYAASTCQMKQMKQSIIHAKIGYGVILPSISPATPQALTQASLT